MKTLRLKQPNNCNLQDAYIGAGFLTWAALRSTGISKVFHIPSVPAAVGESDLPIGMRGA
jgi:hypothetical protein